ncbi:hypothetical protein HMPREF9374_3314 [Desmospora sp. 8437]|nr:hypothetical protein HMPREF9374_3314 [Desmospora sp. 8437]
MTKTKRSLRPQASFCLCIRSVVIYVFMAGRDWVSHVVFVVPTIQNHSM